MVKPFTFATREEAFKFVEEATNLCVVWLDNNTVVIRRNMVKEE